MNLPNNIVLTKSFQQKQNKLDVSHLKRIYKLIQKLSKQNKVDKELDRLGHISIGEMKSKHPPYRLYVLIDLSSKAFYIVDWEHKDRQESSIKELKHKMEIALKYGLDKTLT